MTWFLVLIMTMRDINGTNTSQVGPFETLQLCQAAEAVWIRDMNDLKQGGRSFCAQASLPVPVSQPPLKRFP